jgi:hypothetical protein
MSSFSLTMIQGWIIIGLIFVVFVLLLKKVLNVQLNLHIEVVLICDKMLVCIFLTLYND